MAVGNGRVRSLLGNLASGSAEVRGLTADDATDWMASFEHREAAIVSRLLVWLATVESDDAAREAQLHALAEFAEHGRVPADALVDVGQLPRDELAGSAVEYFDYLQSLHGSEM
jgi:hypothetical protein